MRSSRRRPTRSLQGSECGLSKGGQNRRHGPQKREQPPLGKAQACSARARSVKERSREPGSGPPGGTLRTRTSHKGTQKRKRQTSLSVRVSSSRDCIPRSFRHGNDESSRFSRRHKGFQLFRIILVALCHTPAKNERRRGTHVPRTGAEASRRHDCRRTGSESPDFRPNLPCAVQE